MFTASKIHKAVLEENIARLEKLASAGANMTINIGYGKTPLHFAARYGKEKSATYLIAVQENLDIKDSDGWTALHTAAYHGQLGIAAKLLKAGADPNLVSGSGSTVYGMASSGGHPEMMDMLKPYMKKVADIYDLPPTPEVAKKEEGGTDTPPPSGWSLMGEAQVAYTASSRTAGYKLTDIFDFHSRERVRIIHNAETQQDSIETLSFDDMGAGTALKAAFDTLTSLGGRADAASIEKKIGKPVKLSPPKAG